MANERDQRGGGRRQDGKPSGAPVGFRDGQPVFRGERGRRNDKPYAKKTYGDDKPYAKKTYGDDRPHGQKPYGDDRPYNKKPYGDDKPYAKKTYGDDRPHGQKPYGDDKPYAKKTYGDDKPYAKRPYGDDKPYAKKTYGDDRPYNKKPYGDDKPYAKKPYGDDKPYNKKPYGDDKPYAKKTYGDDRPRGQRPYGDDKPYAKKTYGDDRPHGQKPYGDDRPHGQKTYGEDKPYAKKPYGDDRPHGQKPYGDDKPYAKKTYGDDKPYAKKPYGDDRPYNKKPYGDDRPHGQKPYGEDKPYAKKTYGDDRPYNKKPYGNRDDDRGLNRQAPGADAAPQTEADALPYLIMGRNAVKEAIKSGRSIDRILVNREPDGSLREIMGLARDRNVQLREVEKSKLDELCMPFGHGGRTGNHQGIVAQVPGVEYVEISDILAAAKEKGEAPFVILLDGIEDPHNLGSIIRSAVCAGAHGVIIPNRRAVSVTAAACKASAGAVEHCLVARVSNLTGAMERLKDQGVFMAGADMSGTPMAASRLEGAIGLVIGGEGAGLSRLVKEKCDFLVSIPTFGPIDSLNASVAAAVLMFEKRRQDGFRSK